MLSKSVENKIEKRIVLIIASLTSFLIPFMGSSINIALPRIGDEFSMDAVSLTWVATSYLLAGAMFLVPFGKLSDIHGRKKVFVLGMLIYTIASFLSAIANSGTSLIIFRIINGIGSAMVFSTGTAILTSVFPVGERGKALGFNLAAVYMGLSAGPFLGGLLTESFGWRSIFYLNIPFGILVIILILWKLESEWAEAKGEKLDILGSIIFGIALVAIMYGFSLLPLTSGFLFIIIGIVSLVLFILWELRVTTPVLDMKLFRNRVFAFSNFAALVNYSATFAVGYMLSLYLQYVRGLSPSKAGTILLIQPVLMAIFALIAGKLSDKIESRIIASLGMFFTVIGLLFLVIINDQTDFRFIVGSLAVLGFGLGLFSSPNTNAIMSSVEKRYLGVASATLSTMRMVGQMLSMGVAMLIMNLYIGKNQITKEYFSSFLSGMKVAFVIFAILCFLGIFASLSRGKTFKS